MFYYTNNLKSYTHISNNVNLIFYAYTTVIGKLFFNTKGGFDKWIFSKTIAKSNKLKMFPANQSMSRWIVSTVEFNTLNAFV